MAKKIIGIILFLIILTSCQPQYEEVEVCVKFKEEIVLKDCILEYNLYVPKNEEEVKIPITLHEKDICYDFVSDSENIREKVWNALKNYPNDWARFITPDANDPVFYIIESNVSVPSLHPLKYGKIPIVSQVCLEKEKILILIN